MKRNININESNVVRGWFNRVGVDEKAIGQMISAQTEKLVARLKATGESVTEELSDAISEIVGNKVLSSIYRLGNEVRLSQEQMKEAFERNFNALKKNAADFTESLYEEIETRKRVLGGLEAALRKISDSVSEQADSVIEQLGRIIESDGDRTRTEISSDGNKTRAEIENVRGDIRSMEGRLSGVMEQIRTDLFDHLASNGRKTSVIDDPHIYTLAISGLYSYYVEMFDEVKETYAWCNKTAHDFGEKINLCEIEEDILMMINGCLEQIVDILDRVEEIVAQYDAMADYFYEVYERGAKNRGIVSAEDYVEVNRRFVGLIQANRELRIRQVEPEAVSTRLLRILSETV